MSILHELWRDESGESAMLSLLLIAAILVIGATVGLVTLRDQIIQEFGDVSVGLERLDQSFDSPYYGTYVDTVTASDTPGQPPDGIGFP